MGTDRLSGKIPAAVAHLKNLELLDLHANALEGELSAQVSAARLHTLPLLCVTFAENLFYGPFPGEFLRMRGLAELYLSGLRLTGTLPRFGDMSGLKILDLSSNIFTGTVPDFQGCSALRDLRLMRNRLTGSLPRGLGSLSLLVRLDISFNRIESMQDVPWGQADPLLCADEDFRCHHGFMGNLTNLTSLRLASNRIEGSLSPGLADMRNMETLDLSRNRLNGGVPVRFNALRKLRLLDLSANADLELKEETQLRLRSALPVATVRVL